MKKVGLIPVRPKVDVQAALAALERARMRGPDPRLSGLTPDGIIKKIRREREEVWREKLARRP